MPKQSTSGGSRQSNSTPYPSPAAQPDTRAGVQPKPRPCRCGCKKIVHQDLTSRAERYHLEQQRRNPQPQAPELSHQAEHYADICTRYGDLWTVSTFVLEQYLASGYTSDGGQGGSSEPTGPLELDNLPIAEANTPQDGWNNNSDDYEMEEDIEPPLEADDGINAQNVLDRWSRQHQDILFRGVEVDVEGEEEEDMAAPWMQFVDEEGEPLDGAFDYDHAHEYHVDMGDLDAEIEEELERIVAAFKMEIEDDDRDLLRAYNLKHQDNLTEETFAHFAYAFPKHKIASLKVARKRVEYLSNVSPEGYDCCVNICLLYVGPHEDLTVCPHCNEPRFYESGGIQKARKKFNYIPCTERLQSLYQNAEMIDDLLYRENYTSENGVFKDVFDGQLYNHLRDTNVTVGDVEYSHKFFDQPTDIALGFATDGFSPFKSRKQTCWPLLVYNYNLPPETRLKVENLICVGVIPGPKKPKDMDSFFWPFVFEMLELAIGIKTYHSVEEKFFTLRAYPILGGGDMPAVAMMMLMKGHNGVHPCRMCNIHAVMHPVSCRYYVPLSRPHNMPDKSEDDDSDDDEEDSDREDIPDNYNPRELPLRSHDEFIAQGKKVQSTPNATQAEAKAKRFGIKGVPILSLLPSLSFPASFPFDFMHLLYENVIKNLICFWCGTFKDLDHTGKEYRINKTVWQAIGEATRAAGKTTPSAYGPAVPDLSADGNRITADMYSFWFTFLGPVFLEQAFDSEDIYQHFVELVRLINKCLQLSITREEIEEIREGFIWWVEEYERIYYRYDVDRLSACTSTVHSLLHIADGILLAGPVWVYWAFAMERFCGKLARMIHSRRFPFSHLDNQVLASAQLTQIKNKFNLHKELALGPSETGAAWQFDIPEAEYSKYALVAPRIKKPVIAANILHKLAAALVTRYSPLDSPLDLVPVNDVKQLLLLPETVIEAWGRLRRRDGDTMLASDVVASTSEDRRDATFVRYRVLVDRRAHSKKGQPDYQNTNFYGQLKYVYLIRLPPTPIFKLERTTYIALAVIQECKGPVSQHPSGLNMHTFKQLERIEVVDITTVKCLVGRAHWLDRWVLFDRSDPDMDSASDAGEEEDMGEGPGED